MEDIQKSIRSTLYERVSSPFWGALILSWIVWNWRIFYVSFFISEDNIVENKLFFIENYIKNNWINIYLGPALTMLIIILVVPFISNGAYWMHLFFKKWKLEQKQKLESKKLLSIEDSIELRNLLLERGRIFDNLMESKELMISNLNKTVLSRDEELLEKEKIINELNYKIDSISITKDPRKIFPGRWIIEYENTRDKEIFSVDRINELKYEGRGNDSGFNIKIIHSDGYNKYVVAIGPYNDVYNHQNGLDIFYLERTKTHSEFKGYVVSTLPGEIEPEQRFSKRKLRMEKL